jgi:hypothetical protein
VEDRSHMPLILHDRGRAQPDWADGVFPAHSQPRLGFLRTAR